MQALKLLSINIFTKYIINCFLCLLMDAEMQFSQKTEVHVKSSLPAKNVCVTSAHKMKSAEMQPVCQKSSRGSRPPHDKLWEGNITKKWKKKMHTIFRQLNDQKQPQRHSLIPQHYIVCISFMLFGHLIIMNISFELFND